MCLNSSYLHAIANININVFELSRKCKNNISGTNYCNENILFTIFYIYIPHDVLARIIEFLDIAKKKKWSTFPFSLSCYYCRVYLQQVRIKTYVLISCIRVSDSCRKLYRNIYTAIRPSRECVRKLKSITSTFGYISKMCKELANTKWFFCKIIYIYH